MFKRGFLLFVFLLALVSLLFFVALPKFMLQRLEKKPLSFAQQPQIICQILPVDVILVLDNSNSMDDGKLTEAKLAAKEFVDIVLPDGSETKSRIGVASFDNNGRLNLGLTGVTDKALIKRTIDRLSRPGGGKGGTCLECAIDRENDKKDVLGEFEREKNSLNKRNVIILTDGKINRWMQPDGDIQGSTGSGDEAKARQQAQAAVNRVRNTYSVTFTVIQYGGIANQAWLKREIAQIPPFGEGEYLSERDDGTLDIIYKRVARRLTESRNSAVLSELYRQIAETVVSGKIVAIVYEDTDSDQQPDSGEPRLPGWTVTLKHDTSNATDARVTGQNGDVAFDLCPGPYTVKVNPKSGYAASPPDSSSSRSATLNSGETRTESFGYTRSASAFYPWLQTVDYNIRDENSFTNTLPNTTACQGVTIRDGSAQTPGIVFSGQSLPDFGNGQASSRNWIVRGNSTLYSDEVRTSYDTMLLTLARNNVNPAPLPCSSGLACTLSDTALTSQPYIFQGDELVLGGVILASQKILILADNNVRLTGTIRVSPGAFFMIVAKGNISVDSSVGAGAGRFCAGGAGINPQIQGNFSTDRSFIINGGAGCPAADQQLNIAGSIVTNAGRTNGRFVNNRTLCASNSQFPSFTIQPRLDFVLSAPSYMLRESMNWQEVAP